VGKLIAITDESVVNKIYYIRGKKVMLARELAEMYGVETSQLKRQVKRNIERFPKDFMFEMSDGEFKDWRSQFGISKEDKMGLRYHPFCFTEQGVGSNAVKRFEQQNSHRCKHSDNTDFHTNQRGASYPSRFITKDGTDRKKDVEAR
jgi:ORF6N domain